MLTMLVGAVLVWFGFGMVLTIVAVVLVVWTVLREQSKERGKQRPRWRR